MLNPRKKLDRYLEERDSLAPDEFFERFFQDQGFDKEMILGIREVFESQLSYDFGKLRADDDFSKELRMIWDIDSMADVEIVMSLEERFNIEITSAESKELTTFRKIADIVKTKTGYNKTGDLTAEAAPHP